MRSLYPMRVVVLIGLFAWLVIKATETQPLPDWRSGELVAVVPDASMVTDSAFESDLVTLFAKHLNVRVRLVKLTSDDNFTVAQGTGGGTATATVFGVTSGAYSTSSTTSISTMTLLTQDDAANAIEILDNTLRQLNSRRATLGATQNRLESTIKNLSTTVENLSAANSRVRDADIAEETGNLTKMQILQQAGISVLAQANVSTQAVLSLLQ